MICDPPASIAHPYPVSSTKYLSYVHTIAHPSSRMNPMKTVKWLWEWGIVLWIWITLWFIYYNMASYIQAPCEGRIQ